MKPSAKRSIEHGSLKMKPSAKATETEHIHIASNKCFDVDMFVRKLCTYIELSMLACCFT